jgi:hypothetical protein
VVYETRGTTLWFDEWQWALERRGGDVDTYLRPHNEHLSLVPVAVYKALFATVGIERSLPYRAVLVVAEALCAAIVYAYARPRVGALPALACAALLLTLGPGWQDVLWPFQVGWLTSLAAGIGALLALDRGDRRSEAAACALVAVALASSGIGIPIALGVVVDVLSRRPRAAWVVAAPAVLYAIWWVGWDSASVAGTEVLRAPGFAADGLAATVSALTGLAGGDATLGWGRPLAVAAAGLLAWRLARLGRVPGRVAALGTMVAVFWLLTGARRAQLTSPEESRYVHVGAVLVLLLAVELARGVVLPRPAAIVGGVVVALVVAGNLGDLRAAAGELRAESALTRARLGAVELARATVDPRHVVELPGFPLLVVRAGPYFAAARELGSPAATPAQLANGPEPARIAADAELLRIAGARLLVPAPASLRVGKRPRGEAAAAPPRRGTSRGGEDAVARGDDACVAVRARARSPTVPRGGLLLVARGGPTAVFLRRFATAFPARSQATVRRGAGVVLLRLPPDRSPRPWHVRLAGPGRVTACGLRR